MIIKTLVATVILIAIVMLALGIKMLFNKDAKFEMRSCSFVNEYDRKQGINSFRKIEYKKLSINQLKEKKIKK